MLSSCFMHSRRNQKHGIATPKHELDLIQSRLRDALARNWRDLTKTAFHELGMDRPDELVAKSRLITLIADEILRRGLTQAAAGIILDLDQPNVSALMNEKISRFC